MKSIKFLIWILASNELYFTIMASSVFRPSPSQSTKTKRANSFWIPTNANGFHYPRNRDSDYYDNYYYSTYHRTTESEDDNDLPSITTSDSLSSSALPSSESLSSSMLPSITTSLSSSSTAPSSSSSSSSSSTSTSSTTESTDDSKQLKVPQINFYSSTPNSFGLIGQGILFLREVSAAVGTPLPMWIGCPILVFIGVGLMFLPDLTTLGLPLFYPSGAPGDPLAMFPPFLDFSFFTENKFIQESVARLLGTNPPAKETKRRQGGKLRRARK